MKRLITCCVLEDKKVFGFGRTVDNSKFYALLLDIVIRSGYQGKGIGKKLLMN